MLRYGLVLPGVLGLVILLNFAGLPGVDVAKLLLVLSIATTTILFLLDSDAKPAPEAPPNPDAPPLGQMATSSGAQAYVPPQKPTPKS